MTNKRKKPRLVLRQVWCIFCLDKVRPCITRADFIIPARNGHYDLSLDKCTIDPRVVGVCIKCLKTKNQFQKSNAAPVDINHEHLIYGGVW